MKTPLYLVLLLSLLIMQLPLSAQNTEKDHELGLRFSNLDSFGAIYKVGNERTLFRLSLLRGYFMDTKVNYESGDESNVKAQGFGLALGFEKPLPINEHFDFYWGCELGGSYSHSKYRGDWSEETDIRSKMANFDFVLGCKLKTSDHIRISAELLPGFYYSTVNGVPDNPDTKSFGFSFDNQSAVITISYRF